MEPQKHNTINSIPQREAETKEERLLLGLLHQEAERVQFGKVTIEFGIRNGKIDRLTVTEESRVINIGMRD
ncbi:TPA: hypothetical protein DEB29_03420 [Candidatus Wolfebacteria bacterium]|nr:hypothetical protein [Candidatus Wolfebacteria bacterium]